MNRDLNDAESCATEKPIFVLLHEVEPAGIGKILEETLRKRLGSFGCILDNLLQVSNSNNVFLDTITMSNIDEVLRKVQMLVV